MRIHELGLRRDILRNIAQHSSREEEARAAQKLAKLEEPEVCDIVPKFLALLILFINILPP
jgi:hypothetical protein